jgi:hypothetical protein
MGKDFWKNYEAPPRPEGKYVSMQDMAKLDEPLAVSEVIDDERNTYKGEPAPRFLVRGRLPGGMDDVLVGVRKGYSRDDTLIAIGEFLAENEGETVSVRFQKAQGSAYIEINPGG